MRKPLTLNQRIVPVSLVRPSALNPRRYRDPQAEADLTDSIKQHGLLVRPIVRYVLPSDGPHREGHDGIGPVDPAGRYMEIVAGERRRRAVEALGWEMLPVTEIPELIGNDALMLEIGVYDNLDRETLNPYEETIALLQVLANRLSRLKKWSPGDDPVRAAADVLRRYARGGEQRQVAVASTLGTTKEKLGTIVDEVFRRREGLQPRSFVANRLPLLDLPEDVQELLARGSLDYTAARQIGRIEDPAQRNELLARADQLSVRELGEEIRALRHGADGVADRKAQRAAEIRGLLSGLPGRARAIESLDHNGQSAALAALRRLHTLLGQANR